MEREEDFLRKQFGSKEVFKVPENYFDDFAERLMEKLPEEKAQVVEIKNKKTVYLRSALLAAAAVVVAFFSINMFIHTEPDSAPEIQTVAVSQGQPTDTFDEMADYTMMDNQDMYAYVSNY